MEVTRYIFQSPYSNQVQIGTPDATSSQETKSEDFPSAATGQKQLSEIPALKPVQTEKSTDSKVTPKVESSLDTYA